MPHRRNGDHSRPTAFGLGLLCVFLAAYEIRALEAEWHVGLARAKITPQEPIAMSGYGERVSEGVLDDLYAKAGVIDRSRKTRDRPLESRL